MENTLEKEKNIRVINKYIYDTLFQHYHLIKKIYVIIDEIHSSEIFSQDELWPEDSISCSNLPQRLQLLLGSFQSQ